MALERQTHQSSGYHSDQAIIPTIMATLNAASQPQRHPTYYFDDGNIVFAVSILLAGLQAA
jgi:hypothetical protein